MKKFKIFVIINWFYHKYIILNFNELLKDFYFFIKKEKRLSQINDKNHQFATAPFFIFLYYIF
ncbi:hypothetical protein RN95_04750 [Fusobacterium nucleatum subsp. nucleatum]|nr:hypothetical protein RN95_04750 [Fusobacterium nucleatum subsp. nucleatum]